MSSPLSTPGPCESGAAHGAILLFLPLALMSALLNSSVPAPLYPHYQQMLALSDVSLTLIYGGYAAGVLISLFRLGNLAGRVTDLRAMILPALLAVLVGLLFSLADSFWSLLLARVLAGIGTGALTGAANVALLRFGPRDGGKRAAAQRDLSLHRRAGARPGIQRFGAAAELLSDSAALPAHHGTGDLRHGRRCAELARQRTSATASGIGAGQDTLEELKATGAAFFLCALALFTAWAVAASLLAIGPKVASQLLGMQDLGLFRYLIATYLGVSPACASYGLAASMPAIPCRAAALPWRSACCCLPAPFTISRCGWQGSGCCQHVERAPRSKVARGQRPGRLAADGSRRPQDATTWR